MSGTAVLPDVETLPRSETERPTSNREALARAGDRGSEVGRHVVRALGVVLVGARILGGDLLDPALHVAAHRGIGVLLNDERSARVGDEDGANPVANTRSLDGRGDLMRDVVKAAPFRADRQIVVRNLHFAIVRN